MPGRALALRGASFNLLLELILEFLLWFLTEVIIAAAAAALSAGASIAATVVRVVAKLAQVLGRMCKIVARFAEILVQLARRLQKVAELLTRYRQAVMEIRRRKKQYSMLKSGGWSAEGRAFQIEKFKTLFAGKFLVNQVSPINIPGLGGALMDTGLGLHDVSDGTKDRNYAHDGTYSEDLGKYSKSVQNIFDTVIA